MCSTIEEYPKQGILRCRFLELNGFLLSLNPNLGSKEQEKSIFVERLLCKPDNGVTEISRLILIISLFVRRATVVILYYR